MVPRLTLAHQAPPLGPGSEPLLRARFWATEQPIRLTNRAAGRQPPHAGSAQPSPERTPDPDNRTRNRPLRQGRPHVGDRRAPGSPSTASMGDISRVFNPSADREVGLVEQAVLQQSTVREQPRCAGGRHDWPSISFHAALVWVPPLQAMFDGRCRRGAVFVAGRPRS